MVQLVPNTCISWRLQKPSGQDFVAICLVTNVPHHLVFGRIEDIVQGDCQFDHAEACPEVAAFFADHIHNVLPEFIADLWQILHTKFCPEIMGLLDLTQKGSWFEGGVLIGHGFPGHFRGL